MMRTWPLLLLVVAGCSRSSNPDGHNAHAQNGATTSPTRQRAEVTPELAAKAEEILRENEGAAVGTEIPFSMAGRRYVGRIEEHDNPEGDPERPAGKHKGVTVYVAE